MKTQYIETLTEHLSKPAREVVSTWFDDIDHQAIIKNIVRSLSRHRRANHRKVAFGYVLSRVQKGESLEHLITSWHGSGGYLIKIGVGPGFMRGSIKRDEIGVEIRDRGIEVFKLRALYAEAEAFLKHRRVGLTSLFNL